MDDRLEISNHETDFMKSDDANFITKQEVRLNEGLMMQNSALQIHSNYGNNICRSKSDSALWKKNKKLKLDRLMKDSINLMINFDTDKSVSDISDAKFQGCHQLLNDDNSFLCNDRSSHGFFFKHTSLSLPTISVSHMNTFLMKDKFNELDNTYTYKNVTYLDEEETIFNQPSETKNLQSDLECSMNKNSINVCKSELSETENDKNDFKKHSIVNNIPKVEQPCKIIVDRIDSQLDINNIQSSSEKTQSCEDLHKEDKLNSTSTVKTYVQSNLSARPTLADDSKLVKMSLLTNPINIMQSNVQLLNRSRNFLNFITEKSTNIMEKALLPQHLTMRYNHLSKTVETDTIRALRTTNETPLENITCKSDTHFNTNSNNQPNVISCTINRDCGKSEDELDGIINEGNEVKQFAFIKENKIYDLEDEMMSDKKKYILDKNDISELDCNTNERTKYEFSLTEKNESKKKIDKLHDDVCKTESSDVHILVDSDTSNYCSLNHSLHCMLLEDHSSLRPKHFKSQAKLSEKINCSEKSYRSDKEAQTDANAYNLQVESLEKAVIKLTTNLNASLVMQETLKNECTAVNKEKENMVMKYVISEKQLIDLQRSRDSVERKAKELLKDQEALQYKLRQMQGERTRLGNILDARRREIADHQKEIERLKEDAKMKEVQLKWTQSKLKTEMELQKDTQQKLDKALVKINDMKEECEQIRRETQESFRKFQQSEENKAVTLDQQLKEHQARLILERHVTEDKETLRLQLQKELEVLKSRQQDLIEENKKLNLKTQESEKIQLSYENNLSDLKNVVKQRQEQITKLLNKVSHLEALKLQLQHKEEYITSIEVEMQQLRSVNEEMQIDMQACRQKEADMLDFTQKLTDKNVRLQSEFTAIQRKAGYLESEHGPLRDCISELTNKVKALERDLTEEQKKRREECELLAKHVAEQTQLVQNIAQKLEDSQGENAVLKRKHQISIKEMTRELQQCRRKLEMFEATSPSNSLNNTSRTGSNTSLNTGDTLNGALSDNNANGDHIYPIEPNKQVLIDHIIKLQEINAKRSDRVDFLEEHTLVLTEEVKKKKKIIQNYILQQDFGALGCNERDRHKAELARHGGIMASVYNHRVSDENMTLELSLEINQKLQTVLEDVLLKNITLKDNIDTLGKEIAKLTMQHQQRQMEN